MLAADRVQIGSHGYPTLDLTSTDALMDAAGAAVEELVTALLAQLGDAGQVVQLLVGLQPPPGQAAVPTITLAALAHDPLAAVASYWHTLVTDHADAVPALLGVVRDVLAADGTITGAILGDGTAAAPWRIRLAPGFELQVQVDGAELRVTAMGTTSVDTLGARCTVVEGNAGIELATIDLAGGHAAVMTGLVGTLTMRGRGLDPPRAVLDLGAARLEADHVGVAIRWTPAGGLRFATSAPNLAAVVGETSVPLALPTGDALDDAGLAAAETLIGLLAPLAPSWLESVVGLLGWGARVGTRRLSLVGLLGSGADPAAAVAGWLAPALGQVGPDALSLLADLLAGDGALAGVVEGEGTPEHPFELALSSDGTGPTLAIWFPPAGPSALLTVGRRRARPLASGRARAGDRRARAGARGGGTGRGRRRRPRLEPGPERRAGRAGRPLERWRRAHRPAAQPAGRRGRRDARGPRGRPARRRARPRRPARPRPAGHVPRPDRGERRRRVPRRAARAPRRPHTGQPGARDVHRAGAGQRRLVRRARDPSRVPAGHR